MKQCIIVALGFLVSLMPALQPVAGEIPSSSAAGNTKMSLDEEKSLSSAHLKCGRARARTSPKRSSQPATSTIKNRTLKAVCGPLAWRAGKKLFATIIVRSRISGHVFCRRSPKTNSSLRDGSFRQHTLVCTFGIPRQKGTRIGRAFRATVSKMARLLRVGLTGTIIASLRSPGL